MSRLCDRISFLYQYQNNEFQFDDLLICNIKNHINITSNMSITSIFPISFTFNIHIILTLDHLIDEYHMHYIDITPKQYDYYHLYKHNTSISNVLSNINQIPFQCNSKNIENTIKKLLCDIGILLNQDILYQMHQQTIVKLQTMNFNQEIIELIQYLQELNANLICNSSNPKQLHIVISLANEGIKDIQCHFIFDVLTFQLVSYRLFLNTNKQQYLCTNQLLIDLPTIIQTSYNISKGMKFNSNMMTNVLEYMNDIIYYQLDTRKAIFLILHEYVNIIEQDLIDFSSISFLLRIKKQLQVSFCLIYLTFHGSLSEHKPLITICDLQNNTSTRCGTNSYVMDSKLIQYQEQHDIRDITKDILKSIYNFIYKQAFI